MKKTILNKKKIMKVPLRKYKTIFKNQIFKTCPILHPESRQNWDALLPII